MLLQKLIMDMFNVNSDKVCKNAVYIFDNYFLIISRRHSVLCILQAKQSAAYCAKKSKNLFLLFTRGFIAD